MLLASTERAKAQVMVTTSGGFSQRHGDNEDDEFGSLQLLGSDMPNVTCTTHLDIQ